MVKKIAKIAHGLCFAYETKLVAMATSLEESEQEGLAVASIARDVGSSSTNRSSDMH